MFAKFLWYVWKTQRWKGKPTNLTCKKTVVSIILTLKVTIFDTHGIIEISAEKKTKLVLNFLKARFINLYNNKMLI